MIQECIHFTITFFKASILPTCCSQPLLCQIPSFDLNSQKNAISQMISLHSLMESERDNNLLVSTIDKAKSMTIEAYSFLPSTSSYIPINNNCKSLIFFFLIVIVIMQDVYKNVSKTKRWAYEATYQT